MIDRLFGLGHHPVIGGHDQDYDVGHIGASSPHGRESRVTGSIEKSNRP